MISNLTKYSAKVNPIFLNNLQTLYLLRARVLNGKNLQSQSVESVFEDINNFKDGRGESILKKFDELFALPQHKEFNKFSNNKYELLNTSYVDSLYITAILETKNLITEIKELIKTLEDKANKIDDSLKKVGRINGPAIDMKAKNMYLNWANYLAPFVSLLEADIQHLQKVPLGSKLNTDNTQLLEANKNTKEEQLLEEVNKHFNLNLKPADDRLVALSQLSQIVQLSGTLNNLATVAMKIANDVRFLSSGPRSGFGELAIPENEPGSSIMPGKVNPTQCESLTMVASQVIGNHSSVSIANAAALFESNSFKPLIANNTLRSITLLADGFKSFKNNCAVGIELIETRIKENLNNLI